MKDAQEQLQLVLFETIGGFQEMADAHDLDILAGVVSTAAVVAERIATPDFLRDLAERPDGTPEAVAFYDAIEALLKLHQTLVTVA